MRSPLALLLLTACATIPGSVDVTESEHPNATFEAMVIGCDWTSREVVRPFTRLGSAVAWGRAVASAAPRDRPCEVAITAVENQQRADVYQISRDARGIWSIGPIAAR
jgi:hypothetical protein